MDEEMEEMMVMDDTHSSVVKESLLKSAFVDVLPRLSLSLRKPKDRHDDVFLELLKDLGR